LNLQTQFDIATAENAIGKSAGEDRSRLPGCRIN
jgi:hypothetical protein